METPNRRGDPLCNTFWHAQHYGISEIPAKFLISPEGELPPKMTFNEIDKSPNYSTGIKPVKCLLEL